MTSSLSHIVELETVADPVILQPIELDATSIKDLWLDVVLRWVDQKEHREVSLVGIPTGIYFSDVPTCFGIQLDTLLYVSFRQTMRVQVVASQTWLLGYINLSLGQSSVLAKLDTLLRFRYHALIKPSEGVGRQVIDQLLESYDICLEQFKVVNRDGTPYDLKKLHRAALLDKLNRRPA